MITNRRLKIKEEFPNEKLSGLLLDQEKPSRVPAPYVCARSERKGSLQGLQGAGPATDWPECFSPHD
jgi:hypothetical protein